jgi:drug/metabolite transporter (DMT)-like permease
MSLASALALLIVFLTKNLNVSLAKERLIWYLGLLNGFSYLIQYVGMNYTTASKSSLLVNLSAIWVAVLSWLILKERFSKKKMSGIALGVIGVFFVTTNLDPFALTQGMILGDGLVFLAGIIWSFFMVYNKRLVDTYNVIQFMPWLFLATTLPLIPFIPFSTNISLMNFSIEAWMIIIYTASFCWVVPYYLWIRGLEHISPATSTVILLIEVITAIAISIFLLGDPFTLISGIGASLILLAITLVSIY